MWGSYLDKTPGLQPWILFADAGYIGPYFRVFTRADMATIGTDAAHKMNSVRVAVENAFAAQKGLFLSA